MKKIALLVTLAVFCLGGSLFAQEKNSNSKFKESEFYYFNIPIEKIYSYRHGYVVIYRKGVNQMARTYIPSAWFTDASGPAEQVVLGPGKEWPSMTVYYKEGAFSHVRLRLRREKSHETWGVVPLNINMDEYFDGVEEVKLEF